MNVHVLDHMIECQSALIAALDRRDPGDIEAATKQLEFATAAAQKFDVWHGRDDTRNDDTRSTVEYGLKQCNAARTRIHYLSQWTRQNIERLNGLRGKSRTDIYCNPQNNAVNRTKR